MKKLLVIVILLSTASLAGAELYRWEDENGVVTFKDTPPPPSKKSKKVKVYNDGDFAPAPVPPSPRSNGPARPSARTSPPASAPQKARFSGTVEIYVTEWCGYCKQAIAYMNSKGIPFVAYDIEKDSAARQRHKELGGRGVPLIVIGSRKLSGFSANALEYHLNNSQ